MKFPSTRTLVLAGGAVAAAALARNAVRSAISTLQPIAALDLRRYLGDWFEIARYPNRFERQCAGGASAHYALLADGQVQVSNRCRRADGSVEQAVGAARQCGGPQSARLQVRFAPAWLSLVPLVWADYWVIDLDPDYTLAAVSEPRRDYLWILARTPEVEPAAYQALLARLVAQGFDLERLVPTPQP